MYGIFRYLPIILAVMFVISMTYQIIRVYRKRRQWDSRKNRIVNEGYMKIYLQIEDGQGEIFASTVDGNPLLSSSEVIRKAIFLPPGENKIVLWARAKDNSVSDRILPYYRDLGPFQITILAKKDGVATLYLNVDTQNMYLKESEEN